MGTFRQLLANCLQDFRLTVTEQQVRMPPRIIYVLVAIDVPFVGSLGMSYIDSIRFDITHVVSDATRKNRTCLFRKSG